jgi:hypothetical protein
MRASIPVAAAAGFLLVSLLGWAPRAGTQDLESAVTESYPTNLSMLTDAAEAAVAQTMLGFSAPAGATLLVEAADEHEANWFLEDLLLARLGEAGYQAYLKAPSAPPSAPEEEAEDQLEDEALSPEAEDFPPVEPDSAGADSAAADAAGAGSASLADLLAMAQADTASGPEPAAEETASEVEEPSEEPEPEPRPEYVLRYRVVQFEITYPDSYRKSPLGSRKVQRRASVSLIAHLLRGEREEVVWGGHGEVERLDVVPHGKLSLLEGSSFPFNQPTLETRGIGSLVEPALVTGIVVGLVYLFYTNQN